MKAEGLVVFPLAFVCVLLFLVTWPNVCAPGVGLAVAA